MIEVTHADLDCRNAIYKELTGLAVIEPVASQHDWMDKYLAAHRISAEKAVLDKLRVLPDDVALELYHVAGSAGIDLAPSLVRILTTALADALVAKP